MSTSEYTVFTESIDDHSIVHIISHVGDYFAAKDLARRCRGIIMYRDHFEARFTSTSPNRMNGRLGDRMGAVKPASLEQLREERDERERRVAA